VAAPTGERGGVVGAVEGGADVVAHPAVDGDVAALRALLEGDGLNGPHAVEGEAARADDRAPRLDRDARGRRAELRARPAYDVGERARDDGGGGRGRLGGVGDAVPAAEVVLVRPATRIGGTVCAPREQRAR